MMIARIWRWLPRWIVFAGCLAQALGAPAAPQAQEEAKQEKPAEQPKEEAKKDEPKAAPAQPAEGFRWGVYEGHSHFEVGYRIVPEVAGNKDVYRSMINLGSGPRLLSSHLSLRSNYGAGVLFDRLDLSVSNWGGDPYNTFRLDLGRADTYELRFHYSNLNYYNFLPAYANPLLGTGGGLGQHSLNVTARSADFEIKLRPSKMFSPFFGYSHATGFGPGFTTLGLSGNEFLLRSQWHYSADEYRGGFELALPRTHVTVEQGFRTLKNDTGVSDAGASAGNGSRTFVGQRLDLASLGRGYHDRAAVPLARISAKLEPFKNLHITGRYLYSGADVRSEMGEIRKGNLVSLEDLLVYTAAAETYSTQARKPAHTGSFAVEFSPWSRLTLSNQFDARSYDVTGAGLLSTGYFGIKPLGGGPPPSSGIRVDSKADTYLSYDMIRNQSEIEVELGGGFSVRGGYRYGYVETALREGKGSTSEQKAADITQETEIYGFAYRPGRRLYMALDLEMTDSTGLLTRTDLLDYNELRFDWRVTPMKNLTLGGRVGFLYNRNRQLDVNLRARNRNYTFSVDYEPSERFRVNLDYQRSFALSSLAILLPHNFSLDTSLYDERCSSVGGSLGIDIFRGLRTDFGYRALISAGDLPLNFYQPFAALSIPLGRRMAIKSNWQYFGYNEKATSLQDHRSHLVTIGLAVSY